ncbi:endo-1,4-beta-xylanase [Candidatus Poribacteria bacterium]|nr:endo-1,4-beta-xylanase [Candidatus Poribacteria bacterium]
MTNEDLLAMAKERIKQHREGDGVVVVRSADGNPIAGATVKVEQVRHDFLFGCNFFRFAHISDPQREEEYRQRFAALLNYATLGFYWASYEPERGKPRYEYTDKVVDWCYQNRITVKGHPLAWDHPASSPNWLPDNVEEIERLSTGRVRDIISRFKGRIDIWDVVNEPTDLTRFSNPMNTWARQLGGVPFTALHLKVARAANPGATLLVNDYRTDPPYFDILNSLRAGGKLPFDAIGIQSHMQRGGWPLQRVWEVCDNYSYFGVPIHFTETTIVSGVRLPSPIRGGAGGGVWGPTTSEGEVAQADYVPQFYTMLFAHPAVGAVTWWDFSDDSAWQGAPAGWLREDMSPKPVYEQLMALIKGEWWTKIQGHTNAQGEFHTRAFHGAHRLAVQLPSGRTVTKEVHWERGKVNRFEIVIDG